MYDDMMIAILINYYYTCNAAAMGSARDKTSNGSLSVTWATVLGQESVIQKYLNPCMAPPSPSGTNLFQDSLGKTPCVT